MKVTTAPTDVPSKEVATQPFLCSICLPQRQGVDDFKLGHWAPVSGPSELGPCWDIDDAVFTRGLS